MGTSALLKIRFLAAIFIPAILFPAVNANQEGKKRSRKGNETNNNAGGIVPEIVGGLNAPKRFFTHQVSHVIGNGQHYCGGSLIANNVVLGAAHCVEGFTVEEIKTEHRIHINKYFGLRENPNMEVLRICDIAVHPGRDSKTQDYDFALYKLCEDSFLAKMKVVIPIKLSKMDPAVQQVLTVTGWGVLKQDGNVPDELQMVNVNYIDTGTCTTPPFSYTKDQITMSMMCAGALVGGGRDSCQGDSGGPLILQGTNKRTHLLIGVVSWGVGCADPSFPGIYGRVSYVLDWIKNTACPWIEGSCSIKTN
jgi:trypsin